MRKDRFISDEDTEIDKRDIVISDFINLLNDIESISKQCHLLNGGTRLTFGNNPLKCFNLVILKHIEVIEELYENIKAFKKNNSIILSELKDEEERKERERRLDAAEKKKEESKPERRKTREL
ncbi:hypothetical protein KM1_323250 [Entamoeba histolytica HM-3:IMSS]|uniref:Uncharacterized protein n=4 Tax=Entamoeba histolytica TaxID=5759 RepID=B1N3P6_ENTH1|nr:hypothetical protein EHI_078540 [Entamoeba histolytica HM-1:IMSS]EDS89413.1 hypothetical protein EHI_078540 [Entamoeba histolytica HM-1:IMSS]EMD49088.1 Hypothetical protein EHI5A_276160 [Entamoeba histolytica KU27]EMS15938.1 hypothetical protein KM1_323250 [Entamoeba histolytica HM-3:IMSS]|eukprot:XP_001913812.1 hypothetical protein EHI_078540 [Entamoeba histolytica HM-1:IMSS]